MGRMPEIASDTHIYHCVLHLAFVHDSCRSLPLSSMPMLSPALGERNSSIQVVLDDSLGKSKTARMF